jgi:hypothetical protein
MGEYKGVCILTHISGDAHFYGLTALLPKHLYHICGSQFVPKN